jgi:hypothetical protein
MNAVVKNLVLNATKAVGLNPDEIMEYTFEQLTPAEYKEVKGFLEWCVAHGKKYGWGNIDERLEEYKKSKR